MTAPAASGERRWRAYGPDIFAGTLTACVFYAEYLGLGATLATALPGQRAVATAGMLVLGGAIVACLLAILMKQPVVPGPRAASLSVMAVGMVFAVRHAAVPELQFPVAMLTMSVMVGIAGIVQFIGLSTHVQVLIRESHLSLRKGFMFATAVGIVVGLGANQLEGCLRVSPGLTTLTVVCAAGGAIAITAWCRHEHAPAFARKLLPLSTIFGVAVATLGYVFLVAPNAHSGLCATLGNRGLQLTSIGPLLREPKMAVAAWAGVPSWVWAIVVLWGVVMGLVMLLESLSTLGDGEGRPPATEWGRYISISAAANILAAPLGLSSTALSASRTGALTEAFGRSSLAVFIHGIVLLVILVCLTPLIALLPQLAIAVALLLVAIQMIDPITRTVIWRGAYAATAEPAQVRTAWLFWGFLGAASGAGVATRSMHWGFGTGVLGGVLAFSCALTSWRLIFRSGIFEAFDKNTKL